MTRIRADELNIGNIVFWAEKQRKVRRCRSSDFWGSRQFVEFDNAGIEEIKVMARFGLNGVQIDINTTGTPWIGNTCGHFLKEHTFELVE